MNFLIPKNVSSKFEFFNGFGFKELFMMLAGLIIGGTIATPLLFITNSIFSILPAVLFTTIGFILGKPDLRTGRNGLDHLMAMRQYRRKRKKYFYRFGHGRRKEDHLV
ncbi:PrgI family protein [Paenibacillus sp. GCM10012307]|uniref:PrgI family protein n=1 Tax=Paenibacillus roseus TaxID=2798579 RepID=A0A934MK06_9BACL|nr:PrgI family protein [Paenibacillus roseus]MBJ6360505.1 PrgI family protein [Paenibacillus roseus]